MEFRGQVTRQVVAAGSKSEHEAVVLLTDSGPLKLRRAGANPFHDAELEKLIGHNIRCDGVVHAGQLLMSNWDVDSAGE
jgi:hypothetical protein